MRHNFKTIVDSLTVPTFVIDFDHTVIAWNKACELLTGVKAEEVLGTKDAWRGFYDSERPCLADVVLDNNKQQLKEYYPINGLSKFSKGLHAENWFDDINGKKRYLIFDAEPIYDQQSDNLIGALENLEDVTEMKQVGLREHTHNEVMAELIKGSALNDIFNSLLNKIEQENPFTRCSILLFDSNEQYLSSVASPSLPYFYNAAIDDLRISTDDPRDGLVSMFSKKRAIAHDIKSDSRWKKHTALASMASIGSCWSEPIFSRENKFIGVFVIYHDVAQTPSSEDLQFLEFAETLISLTIEQNLLRQQQQLSARVFNNTLEGITITNAEGIIIDINPAFTQITGYERNEVIGKISNILSSGTHDPELYKQMWRDLHSKGHWQGELWNRNKSGELYAELLSISSIKSDNGETLNYIGIFTNITEAKQQQEKLNLMAHYDVLTGLPNRVLFIDRFEQAIAHSKRTNTLLAIVFLDLDKFKPVNDNYGHDIGDKLLVQVASRIKGAIRDEDTVSRQGGDEFAILLGDINNESECRQLAKRIHKSLATPFEIDKYTIEIGASSGITIYPNEDADIDTLIRYADQAMYQAKLAGRNRYHLFSREDNPQAVQKQNQLYDIEQAFSHQQMQLYYQPKVNMLTGKVYGMEALIRWKHPDKGLITPLEFLPLIDGTDLEIEVGDWVINQALQQLYDWQNQGVELEVSINISSRHILSDSFFNTLDDALAKFPTVDSRNLTLEILETSALGDLKAISHIIELCQDELGIKVALDDFGTGYSSLTHLRNLPANTIKIDRSFVRDMLSDPSDSAIIDGIIGLANAFHRNIIAEGVESADHGIMLILMGCNNAQGYVIAKPMAAESVIEWVSNYTANAAWLSFNRLKLDPVATQSKIFKLVTYHWYTKFVDNINLNENDAVEWPISNQKHCHCGTWIKRAIQDELFEQSINDQLVDAHESFHELANGIRLNYQSGQVMSARELLPKLTESYHKLQSLIA